MIDYVNENLVPVWVNIRCDAFPPVAALWRYGSEWDLFLDSDRKMTNLYYLGFFLRSYILSPDLETLLNEDDGVLGMSTNMSGDSYLPMLEGSVHRFAAAQLRRPASLSTR